MKVLIVLLSLAIGAMASGLDIVESGTDGIVLELSTPQPVYRMQTIRGNNYCGVAIDGTENISDFSLPRVPVYRTWLEIPVGATIESIITDETVLSIDGPAWPIQPGGVTRLTRVSSVTKLPEQTRICEPCMGELGRPMDKRASNSFLAMPASRIMVARAFESVTLRPSTIWLCSFVFAN